MTDSPPGPAPGRKLADCEILGLIGRGGMGEVHRARVTKLGREVALKLLPRELSGEPVDLLVGEQRATGAVYSPDGTRLWRRADCTLCS